MVERNNDLSCEAIARMKEAKSSQRRKYAAEATQRMLKIIEPLIAIGCKQRCPRCGEKQCISQFINVAKHLTVKCKTCRANIEAMKNNNRELNSKIKSVLLEKQRADKFKELNQHDIS